jgi:pimeloyl-ACP methyl ester carboxylesterase
VTELEKRRLRTSAGEFAYVEMGDAENPAVVLLHGFPTSSYLWRNIAPLFSPWMHVIAPDLLGCGDSEAPDVDLGLRAQAGYVRELLDGLGIETYAVVGHGIGGGIAQLLALEGGVGTMILVDAVAFDAWPSEATREVQLHLSAADEVVVSAMIRTAFDLGMGHRERLQEEDLQEYLRPYAGSEGSAACVRLVRAMDGRGLDGTEEALARLEIPVLVLWGESDPYLPISVAERLGDVITTAAVALLPGCSHFLPEDAPETIAPLMFEFLRSRYLGVAHSHGGPVVVELGRRPKGEEVS